jgi:glycerol kinase
MRTLATLSLLLLLPTVLGLQGCRKTLSDIQTKALIDIITSGRWVVDTFTDGSADYRGYEFKFNESGTVDAFLGATTTTGSFVVDALNSRITSRFPAGSAEPLLKLSETWSITKASLSQVEAKPTDAGRTAFLRIRMK